MYDKQALIALVREKALKFGDFTLASGKKATYYLDGKQVTLDSAGARLVAEGILDLLGRRPAAGGRRRHVDRGRSDHGRRGHHVRRPRHAARGLHGPQGSQGARHEPVSSKARCKPGETVVIVEDVVTTGGSSLLAIERVEEFGLKVVGVLAIIDRMEGGAEAFAATRLPVRQPADDPRFRHRAAAGVMLSAQAAPPACSPSKWWKFRTPTRQASSPGATDLLDSFFSFR